MGPSCLKQSLLNSSFSYGSFFSGMGTAEAAVERAATLARARSLNAKARLAFACDFDKGCQALLMQTCRDHGACLIGDVMQTMNAKARWWAASGSCFTTRLAKAMAVPEKAQQCRVPCLSHRQLCTLQAEDMLVGGSPCVDFSKAGLLKGLEGPSSPTLIAWIRRARQAKVAVHENVDGCPDTPFYALAVTHHWWKFLVETSDTGFGRIVTRKRVYRIFIRKDCKLVLLMQSFLLC